MGAGHPAIGRGFATILWKDPENPTKRFSRTLEFGVDIPGTDAAAARVAGGSTVIFVPASLAAAVRKKANDFRSKDVFSGLSDVSHVDIERGRGRVSLVRRDGSWWLSQPFTDLADSDFAQRLVDELTSLKAIEFVSNGDRANLASLGLTPPLYRVTLTSGQGKPPVTAVVELGATQSDGNTMYARRESQVFTVPSSIVEDLSKEAVAFRDRRLVRFDRANVSAIEGVFGAERFALQRKDSGWLSDGKPLTAAPADDLMSAILDLKARTFLDDAQAAALKGRAPAGQVTVKVGANESWTVSLHSSRTDTEALVSRRPGAFLVSGDAPRTLLAAFRRATGTK